MNQSGFSTEEQPKEYSGIYTQWSKSARNKTKTNAEINQGTNQIKPNVEMNIRDMTHQILVSVVEAFRTKGIDNREHSKS
jgi:3-oxoacyl-(acyl-carrier-protein) synthase